MAYKVKQNLQRIKAAADDIREVIDLCYEEVGDDERIEDYAPKLARLAVDDATEQVIATAARTTAGGVAVKDTIAVVDKVYGNTLVWNQFGTPINASRFDIVVTKSGKRSILNGTGTNESNAYLGIVHAADKVIAGHKYLNAYISQNEQLAWCSFNNGGRTRSIFTTDASHLFNYVISVAPTTTFENFWLIPILFDLTRMFGSGQEPESVDDFCLKIFGKASASVTDSEWEAISAYCEPTLLSSKPKKIVSKPADASYTSEITIDPTAIVDENGEQVFPNGLLSAGTAKDYIDIERGVAVKCVGSVDLGTLTWNKSSASSGIFFSNYDYGRKIKQGKEYFSANGVMSRYELCLADVYG